MAGTKRKTEIPKAVVARILLDAGAKRVSQDAQDAFVHVLEDLALDIGERAAQIARHSGRKTVQEKDIKLAVRQ